MIAGASSCGNRRLAETQMTVGGTENRKIERSRIGRSVGVVAVAAIDIEIGARSRIHGRTRIAPIRVLRRARKIRNAAEIADLGEVRKLVLMTGGKVKVSIQVPGFGPDRSNLLGFKIDHVTSGALVFIGNHDCTRRQPHTTARRRLYS